MHKKSVNPPFLPAYRHGRFANVFLDQHDLHEEHENLWRSIKMFFHALPLLFRKDCSHTKASWSHLQQKQACSTPSVTWLGHATCLIKTVHSTILTDPVFGSLSLFYKRKLPKVDHHLLPDLDVVLISHNHRDHLDKKTIMWLHRHKNPLFLVPQGDKKLFASWGITNAQECTWWDSVVHNDVTYTFVPAWHWSQRGVFDRNRSLWGGWVIEAAGQTVYFAGDTAYNQSYFTAIAQQFPAIDLALVPIGPGDPEHLMRRSHVNAELAGQLFLDSGARCLLPIHWGTFQFGHDRFDAPIKRLEAWWNCVMRGRPGYELLLAPVGKVVHFLDKKSFCSDTHGQNHQKS